MRLTKQDIEEGNTERAEQRMNEGDGGLFSFLFSPLSYKKKEEWVGGHYRRKVLHTDWHRGEGESRATNGQAQKIPCRLPQVDHKEYKFNSA